MESSSDARILVNIGCGKVFARGWRNFDVVPSGLGVERLDVRKGVPLADSSCDAVYHSHVLEHLTKSEGEGLFKESFRLLKPGGIVRIAVPDLEGIARSYLAALERAAAREDSGEADYDWMILELVDQLVRTRGGGEMGEYWSREEVPHEEFVIERMGWQYLEFRRNRKSAKPVQKKKLPAREWLPRAFRKARLEAAVRLAGLVGGAHAKRSLKEGLFRNAGEVHRWMYDRFSLGRVLRQQGFVSPDVHTFDSSGINGFGAFELDGVDGAPRKPDSLYMEATKP